MRTSLAATATGAALVTAGVATWSWQAALVVLGSALVAFGLLRSTE